METIARMVVRDEGDGTARLGLTVLFKSQTFFKPGKVYEFVEILGEILIKEVGDSWIKRSVEGRHVCWGNSIDGILNGAGNTISLTEEEYLDHYRIKEKNNG